MEIEKMVLFGGGIALLAYSFYLIVLGMITKPCIINESCPEAMVILFVIILGVLGISYALESNKEKEVNKK